ncbi:uncharacterized protein METZ01_LOCUS28234 [marine metagenome]|uniref:Uncharacterized protein n=1 Tax=marine metagenome TaxID=408172 RepID=A0A381Q8M8_9ZZZZ
MFNCLLCYYSIYRKLSQIYYLKTTNQNNMEGVSPFLSYLIVSARTQNLSVPVDLLV